MNPKLISKAFEERVGNILRKRNILFKNNLFKEFNRDCEIDILLESESCIYIIDCKFKRPTGWYSYPFIMPKRAKKDFIEFEKDFKKKIKTFSNYKEYNPNNKPIKKMIVSFFPLYVAHYIDYPCLSIHEFIYWLDNYFLKNKKITSLNNFYREFSELKLKELEVKPVPPFENILDIDLSKYVQVNY